MEAAEAVEEEEEVVDEAVVVVAAAVEMEEEAVEVDPADPENETTVAVVTKPKTPTSGL